MRHAGRHRTVMPPAPAGSPSLAADEVEARLLGERPSMGRRDLSAKASVSLRSAQKFWDALGFPTVGDEDVVFSGADVTALQSVADLVRSEVLDEPTALAMIRAMAGTADRLAGWQTQLMAEALGERSEPAELVPDPATALATAVKLADMADDLEPLLIYAWRRHLSAAIARMVTDAEPTTREGDQSVHE